MEPSSSREKSSNDDKKGKKISNDDTKVKKSRNGDKKGKKSREASGSGKQYAGVWKREWGVWVSEIRTQNTLLETDDSAGKKQRKLWLGSYDTAEKAARAHDAGVVCLSRLRNEEPGKLNFPDSLPDIPNQQPLSRIEIQEIARKHADGAASSAPLPPPDNPTDLSLIKDATIMSPVLPRQAGLDFSGYDFLPSPDQSAPENQLLDNDEEEDVPLWDHSD